MSRLVPSILLVAAALAACTSSGGSASTATTGAEASSKASLAPSTAIATAPTAPSTVGTDERTTTSHAGSTAPGPVESPASDPTAGDPLPPSDRYAPAPGEYRYTITGYEESTGPTGSRRSDVDDQAVDTVTIDDENGRVTVTTTSVDSQGEQTTVVSLAGDHAHLGRLRYVPRGLGITYDVRPDPPAMVARLPYTVGDRWEIAWNDPSAGIRGVGTGQVLPTETIDGTATVVIRIEQRLRGVITGQLTITSWTDPTTGTVHRQRIVTDLEDATGASRTDLTKHLL